MRRRGQPTRLNDALRASLQPSAGLGRQNARYQQLTNTGPLVDPLSASTASPRSQGLEHHVAAAKQLLAQPFDTDVIAYVANFLVNAALPIDDPKDERNWLREYTGAQFGQAYVHFQALDRSDDGILSPHPGLPFGYYARLLISWFTTRAMRSRSPLIALPSTARQFITTELGLGDDGNTLAELSRQLTKLFHLNIQLEYRHNGQLTKKHFRIFSGQHVGANYWDHRQPQHRGTYVPQVLLDSDMWTYVQVHGVPFRADIQNHLAPNCTAIDLYKYLSLFQYALHKRDAKAPELIPWGQLAASMGNNSTSSSFHRTVARALELVRLYYPECRTEVRRGGLLVRPGKPSVPLKEKALRTLPAAATGS